MCGTPGQAGRPLGRLDQIRPGLSTALARAEAGERIDGLLDAIAELQRRIDATPAETLEDAAVKLRRLGAYVESGQPARLLAGALGAVERAALRSAYSGRAGPIKFRRLLSRAKRPI